MARIADYETTQMLGSGNHGHVYLASPPARLGLATDKVALKVFDRATDEAEFGRVVDEVKVYASARSQHLAALYDVGRHGERLYLAMEYFSYGSLATTAGSLTTSQKVKAVADAARGAHALHEVGLVHREVKPANVMLGETGAKLADLGLQHVVSPGQTVTGVGISSVETMEPGIVRGEKAARASDIWSLGATLHHALTGQSVFGQLPEGSIIAVLRHVMIATPELAETSVAPELLGVIKRCLDPDRMNRYPTAAALADDLEQVEGLVTA